MMAFRRRPVRWASPAWVPILPLILLGGMSAGLSSIVAEDWYETTGEPTEISVAIEEELNAVPAAEPTIEPSLIEPSPVDDGTFAGEVVDPSSTMMMDGSSNAGAAACVGGLGNASVYAGPAGLGARVFGNYGGGLFREVSAGVFGNQSQTVFNGGTTLRIAEGESWAIMSRGLFGIADDNALGSSSFAYSVDGYAGMRLRSYGGGEHWLKVGGFVDDQDQFGKAGPMFAALLFANEPFPVTIDAAFGFGYGDDIDLLPKSTNIIDVANRDYQLRVGTYLSPTWQVGLSSLIADWESGDDNRSWGVGAFTNFILFERSMVRLDFTSGDEGFRGYAMVSYLLGPTARTTQCGECRVDGKQWLMQPVNRDVALQIRSQNVPLADRLNVRALLFCPPRQALGTGDADGIVEPGETFELDLFVDNTTVVTIASIAVGQAPVVTGSAGGTPQGISGETFNNVAPGATVQTDQASDINVVVPATANAGDTVFVTCDLTVEGVTRRVTFGPVIVGTTANGQTYAGN